MDPILATFLLGLVLLVGLLLASLIGTEEQQEIFRAGLCALFGCVENNG
ncbi:MAG TPA: hypothetical protein VNM45_09190 [Bacillus sp. (in: firmicutes)]|nr:hypothetical protein [Bacillus sp. (in: firmicutes)]